MAQSLTAMQPSSQVDAMPRLRLQFLNILIRISFLSPFTTHAPLILAAKLCLGVLAVTRHPEIDGGVYPLAAQPSRLDLEEPLERLPVVTAVAHFFPFK
jgi:hypothetical protein